MSQKDLARKTHIDEATIVYLEADARHPRPSTVRRLARVLSVQVADLTTPA
jgi:DNA-binding XRE family transcriptional regulator